MTWQILLLSAFGVYYISYAISNDDIDGPWNAFRRLRGIWTDPKDWKARGMRCVICLSFWFALLWALQLLWMGAITYSDISVVWFGLAGISIVIARYWQR